MGGVTGLIILVSSGISVESASAGVLGFSLGAALIVCGRALARSIPGLGSTFADP
jgi:hypothetical protein